MHGLGVQSGTRGYHSVMNEELLHAQLRNHWIGATSGLQLFRRVAASHGLEDVAIRVRHLADEVAADREALRAIMRRVGADTPTVMAELSKVGVLLGRLKPNGHLLTRSPLSDIFELEALRAAVVAKRSGFELLRELVEDDPRLDADQLDELIRRAAAQEAELESLHLETGRVHLRDSA